MKRFRAWNKNTQRFTTDDIAIRNDGPYILTYDWDHDGGKSWGSPYDEYVIQYYTGLKDKNGVEICDGDIVKGKHDHIDFRAKNNKVKKTYAGIIHWNHSYWAIGEYKLFVMNDDSLEILGNTFENPELLEN